MCVCVTFLERERERERVCVCGVSVWIVSTYTCECVHVCARVQLMVCVCVCVYVSASMYNVWQECPADSCENILHCLVAALTVSHGKPSRQDKVSWTTLSFLSRDSSLLSRDQLFT